MKTIIFATIVFASAVAIAQPRPEPVEGQPTSPAASAQNGKKLYERDGCWECHGWAGQGGRDGARLADTALSAAQLTRYVRKPTGAMPAYIDKVMSDQDLADIWAYVRT